MYSKERGFVNEPPAPRRLSYRQPERPRMQVPPNYSGHAIVDGEERPLGRVDATEALGEATSSEGPVPRFDGLPRVSELGESRYRPPSVTISRPPYATDGMDPPSAPTEKDGDETSARQSEADASSESDTAPTEVVAGKLASAPSPSLFSLTRFPFGHGIGWEELLIMGLIWLLLHENAVSGRERGDLDETVILLGVLLLLG